MHKTNYQIYILLKNKPRS